MQLVQELFERDISTFLAQAPNAHVLEERLQAIMDFALEHAQYYYQQFLLWVDFVQQTRDEPAKATSFLQGVWERTRNTLADYLQITNPELLDFIMIFIDGLFVQYIYGRGTQDADWFRQQSQLMIQMVIHHEQNFASVQT